MFDFFGQAKNPFYQVRLVTFQQESCFPVGQTFTLGSFVYQ